MATLHLPQTVQASLNDWVRQGYPLETCGLLLGTTNNNQREVIAACQARNLNRDRAGDRFEIDPDDFMAADTAVRHVGLEVVGVWHSHPDHPAEPSETDRASAWPNWSYLILSVTATGVAASRSWALTTGRAFKEEAIRS